MEKIKMDAIAAVNEWHSMDEAAQVQYLQRMVRRAAKNAIGYTTEDHYLQFFEVPAWFLNNHGYDTFVAETWLGLVDALDVEKIAATNEKRHSKGKPSIPLSGIVGNATRAAIVRIYNQDVKHENAKAVLPMDDDGNSLFEAEALEDTEAAAILRADINGFIRSRDKIDQKIIEMTVQGYTTRQIGKAVGMTSPAVCKRMKGIRNGLKALAA